MTFTQLEAAIRQFLPNASFGEDMDGQLIIYTDMSQTNPNDDEPLTAFESE